jgi:hypothetical protein
LHHPMLYAPLLMAGPRADATREVTEAPMKRVLGTKAEAALKPRATAIAVNLTILEIAPV